MTFALLKGIKVLDLGEFAGGPYCAKLLADAGADVIHVERPGTGDPARAHGPFAPDDAARSASALFAFLNAGKRAVTLDLAHAGAAPLLWGLIEWADIVVENFPPGTLARRGFGNDALLARRSSLVQVSITPYGQNGPYRDFEMTELTAQAMAGLMDGNGEDDREPLRYPMHVAQFLAGANASYAALIAYRHARRTGQGQQVDVSVQESAANTYFSLYADYEYSGALQRRGQKDLYPTADGWIMARWQRSVPWDIFALAMDAVELSLDPELQPPRGMGQSSERVAAILSERLRTRPGSEWFARAQEHEIPAGMLQSLDGVRDCPHLAARSFFDTLVLPNDRRVPSPGPFYTVDGSRTPRVLAVPELGAHNDEVYRDLLGHTVEELESLREKRAI